MQAVTVDAAGAVVAAGYFEGSSATFGGVVLTNAGTASYVFDAWLWKMNAEGTTLWAVRGGGTETEEVHAVAVDDVGAVVAAGWFSSSTATFGGVVLTKTGTGYGSDGFLWKVSAEGTTLWAVRGGGTETQYLEAVAVDDAGAVVAAGYFTSSPATFGGVALTTAGSYDLVVWKVSAEGTTLWAVRGGGTNLDYVQAVAVDGANAVVAAGFLHSSPATFGNVVLTNAANNAMLWKLSAEGTTLWAVQGGGQSGNTVGNPPYNISSNDIIKGVVVDGDNAVVAAGSLSNSPATFGDVVLTTAGSNDAVLWKVSGDGTSLWAVRGGGTDSDYLQAVAVDAAGAVVAVGYFQSSSATFGAEALDTAGGSDAVVWKVNGEGTTLWTVRAGGTSEDYLKGVAVNAVNAVVAAGYFESSPATFGDEVLTPVGGYGYDVVVWKVSDVAGFTYASHHVFLDIAALSPLRTSCDSSLLPSVFARRPGFPERERRFRVYEEAPGFRPGPRFKQVVTSFPPRHYLLSVRAGVQHDAAAFLAASTASLPATAAESSLPAASLPAASRAESPASGAASRPAASLPAASLPTASLPTASLPTASLPAASESPAVAAEPPADSADAAESTACTHDVVRRQRWRRVRRRSAGGGSGCRGGLGGRGLLRQFPGDVRGRVACHHRDA